jgi:hypothetical protein
MSMSEKDNSMTVTDQSMITIPVRNLIALFIFVGIAITGYFNITGRITFLEHNMAMQDVHVKQNNEFRVKWPRGELGSLPDDAEQNMRLTHIEKELKEIQDNIKIYKEVKENISLQNARPTQLSN